MAEVTTLTLAVDSRQVRTATTDLDKLGKQGARTEKDVASIAGAFRGLQAAAGAVAGSLVVREIIAAGDAYANLNARLRLVTRSTSEFSRAQREVFRIAQDTRIGLVETADLYTSLSRSTEQLGVSQADLLQVTESINQALIISGTSAASAQAALVQLGQGFASGALRGEELNSVLEQAPRLARAIAEGLGVTVGQLRQLGQEGQLTAERVFQALQRSSGSLRQEFDQLPLTVSQSITQVQNSLLRLIGTIDQATGATNLLARGFSAVARGIDTLPNLPRTIQLGSLAKELRDAKAELDRLNSFKLNSPIANLIPGLERDIQEAEKKFRDARARFNNAFNNERGTAEQDERRGRGFNRGGTAPSTPQVQIETIASIQERLKGLRSLRDSAALGSQEFRKLNSEVTALENRLAALQGRRGPAERTSREVSEAQRYLDSLRQQLEATEGLTVAEALKRDIQLGRLGAVTAAQERELTNLARQIDLVNQQKQADQERLATINAVRQATIDEFEAVQRANDEYQSLVESLIDATPTQQLERQRKVVQILADEYERGRFGAIGSAEAVKLYGETINEFLGNTEKRIEKTKSLSEEIGLSFTSAFEDAIVSGKRFSDVLKGLEQDIIRLVTRKAVTEPLGNAISGAIGGSGGIGGFFSNIFGSIFGRAIGGPVSAGGLYRVNERGPELLNVGGRQFLMMGNEGGNVSPNAGGASTVTNINISVPVNSPRDRATAMQFGQQVARQLQMAQARNG